MLFSTKAKLAHRSCPLPVGVHASSRGHWVLPGTFIADFDFVGGSLS